MAKEKIRVTDYTGYIGSILVPDDNVRKSKSIFLNFIYIQQQLVKTLIKEIML